LSVVPFRRPGGRFLSLRFPQFRNLSYQSQHVDLVFCGFSEHTAIVEDNIVDYLTAFNAAPDPDMSAHAIKPLMDKRCIAPGTIVFLLRVKLTFGWFPACYTDSSCHISSLISCTCKPVKLELAFSPQPNCKSQAIDRKKEELSCNYEAFTTFFGNECCYRSIGWLGHFYQKLRQYAPFS
jgi:hypothetical protein